MEKEDIYSELVGVLGKEAADRFVDYYSGSGLYVPQRIITGRKYRKIREEFKSGASYRELTFKYGFSERWVRTIIHGKERKK